MVSPLGQYSHAVAAIIAILIVIGWALAEIAASAHLLSVVPTELTTASMLAMGAVFGSVATVNGVKSSLDATNTRLDALGAPQASAAKPAP